MTKHYDGFLRTLLGDVFVAAFSEARRLYRHISDQKITGCFVLHS